jgi:hypothetical protein
MTIAFHMSIPAGEKTTVEKYLSFYLLAAACATVNVLEGGIAVLSDQKKCEFIT